MPKRYDVYLSSTKADLEPERKLVTQIIRVEHGWTLKESYSASDQPILGSCLKDVEDSHVYLCIVGARYGEDAKEDPKWSYTQHEFEHATKLGIPRFVFFKEGGFGDLKDIDADREKVDAFRASITGTKGVRPDQFKSEAELRSALSKCRNAMQERLDADSVVHTRTRHVGRPWEVIFHRLMSRLSPNPAKRWSEVDAGLTELLDLPDLGPLAPFWVEEWPPDVAEDGSPGAITAINRLTSILRNFVAHGSPPGTGSRERQEAMLTALRLLVALTPSEAAWDATSWNDQAEPVRFRGVELMCAVRSITRRRGFDLALVSSDQARPRLNSDSILDLDGAEFGAGANRRGAIQEQVARHFGFRLPDNGQWSEDDVESLAAYLFNRQDIDRRLFALTGLVPDGAVPDRHMLEVARELELTAIPRRKAPADLLRDREKVLEDAVCQCLTAIGKLP